MKNKKAYKKVALVLLIVPFILALWKVNLHKGIQGIAPKTIYSLEYEFDMSNLAERNFVKAYIPTSNYRQTVHTISGDAYQSAEVNEIGTRARWNIEKKRDTLISYSLEVETRPVTFHLSKDMPFLSFVPDSLKSYLSSTDYIQTQDPSIVSLAKTLKKETLYTTLKANYDAVYNMVNSGTNVKTDALTTLRRGRASCNGKSRLFVALCRGQGIPARVVGGLILETVEKRTSHLWAEVFTGGQWIPFDVQNGYFAYLPAHYLDMYKGDKALIAHNPNIHFDYQFKMEKQYQLSQKSETQVATLWGLLQQTRIPIDALSVVLLLPLAALIVAIFKNVIGFKTFGVLLPALVGLALAKVDLLGGIVAFAAVIMVISLLHKPLLRLGLLHTPKLVIMLVCVVLTLVGLSIIGEKSNWSALSSALFLPVVIVSITAERFAKTLEEEQAIDAFKILGNTFLIAFVCCPIFSSRFLLGLFLTHPELYFPILGVLILLGRWIGFRISEYQRFKLINQL